MGDPAHTEEAFHGSLIRVEVERWAEPERRREVVRHPGAAAVVAVTAQRDVVLVRQLREAVRRRMLEIPAGILDVAGEPPHATAGRELEEETGFRAGAVTHLGTVHTSPGFADERIDLFLAEAQAGGSPEGGIEVVTMPFADAITAVLDGRITDAKTVAGLLLARLSTAGRALGLGE